VAQLETAESDGAQRAARVESGATLANRQRHTEATVEAVERDQQDLLVAEPREIPTGMILASELPAVPLL